MKIRNRIADVDRLMTEVCQDLLKLVVEDGWKNKLYSVASKRVNEKSYRAIYEKMRDKGLDEYDVHDMDISALSTVIRFCKPVVCLSEATRRAMKKVTDTRNDIKHETDLYTEETDCLRAIIALCFLQDFVRTVDSSEKTISDAERLKYRVRYIKMIDELKEQLDEERIAEIEKEKSIDRDIKMIVNSRNLSRAWGETYKLYENRDRLEGSPESRERLYMFVDRASDEGIEYAHFYAFVYSLVKKDYVAALRRIEKSIESCKNDSGESDSNNMKKTAQMINDYLRADISNKKSIDHLIEFAHTQNISIIEKNGVYTLQ